MHQTSPFLKTIYNLLKSFIKEDFEPKSYLFTATVLIILLYLNYFSGLKGPYFSFEEKISDYYLSKNKLFFCYLPFYAIPYFAVLSFKLYNSNDLQIYNRSIFWVKALAIFLILSFDGGFYFNNSIFNSLPYDQQTVLTDFVNAGHSFLTSSFIIIIFYFIIENKSTPHIYGLARAGFHIKPYLGLLAIMVPIVYFASTTAGFLDQYPTMTGTFVQETFGLSKTMIIGIYEFIYLSDFINLELMMRGFLVIGMAQLLGKNAILPATTVYLMLHFEKPIAEALGSIFGGYILGVIAYKTRNIYGGFIVHMGIAALMEVFAHFQLYLNR